MQRGLKYRWKKIHPLARAPALLPVEDPTEMMSQMCLRFSHNIFLAHNIDKSMVKMLMYIPV